jgi:hypothetical protein
MIDDERIIIFNPSEPNNALDHINNTIALYNELDSIGLETVVPKISKM